MAGIVKNLRLDGRVLGAGLLWGGLPIPLAGQRLSLAAADADGFITPDATANPNAYPIGATKDGAVCSAKVSRTKFQVNEIPGNVDAVVEQVMMSIQANLHGIGDPVIQKLIGAGFMKQNTGTGYVENTVGFTPDTFQGIALIAPLRNDPSKVFVFHEYKALNESGFEFGVRKAELGSSQSNFEAYAVYTRALSDLFGNWWTQTV